MEWKKNASETITLSKQPDLMIPIIFPNKNTIEFTEIKYVFDLEILFLSYKIAAVCVRVC